MTKGLIAGHAYAASFVSLSDELEEYAGFSLVFADVTWIVEHEGVAAIKLCDRCRQDRVAVGRLKVLDHVGCTGEENALAAFDQRGGDSNSGMSIAASATFAREVSMAPTLGALREG